METNKQIIIKNVNVRTWVGTGKKYTPLTDNELIALAEKMDNLLGQSGIVCEIEFSGVNYEEPKDETN